MHLSKSYTYFLYECAMSAQSKFVEVNKCLYFIIAEVKIIIFSGNGNMKMRMLDLRHTFS